MELLKKRQTERDEMKQEREEHILQCALSTFMLKGLEQTTMKDVSIASEVGVATVFRYFPNKKKLVIEAAAVLWKREFVQLPAYLPSNYETLKGSDQFKSLLEVYLFHYQKTPELFRFLEQFDNFIANSSVEYDQLFEVESSILSLKDPIFKAIEKGIQDQSIKSDFDINLFYFTSMHTLMSIIQKFVIRGSIFRSDMEITGEAQIKLAIEMICDYIRFR